jgi:hypothetical protein
MDGRRARNNPLPRGGHCEAIRSKGPFVIGQDFCAPAPVAREIRRIKLPPDVLDRLERCLKPADAPEYKIAGFGAKSNRKLFVDATRHLTWVNGVSEALSWYLSDYQFQPDEKDIRAQLKTLERTIDRFKGALPSEHAALGTFLRGTYTGEIFLRDNLKPNGKVLARFQKPWREQHGFDALNEHLDAMKSCISAATKLLGKRKPLKHRKAALVRALARTWQKLTGHWPESGRDSITSRQTGPFAEFVRIACDLLPDFAKVGPLDAAIRTTCEKPDTP